MSMSGDERASERPENDSGSFGRRDPGPTGGPQNFRPPLPQPRPEQPGVAQPGGVGLLLAEAANSVSRALIGFLLIYWLCQFLGLDTGSLVVLLLWTLSGLVVIWPGIDDVLARYVFGLRRPTLVESQ